VHVCSEYRLKNEETIIAAISRTRKKNY